MAWYPYPTITIDGPSGVGKTTKARLLALRLGLRSVETGALWRALGLLVLRHRISPDDEGAVLFLMEKHRIGQRWDPAEQRAITTVDQEDVSEALASGEVASTTSRVAALPRVREAMIKLQRKLIGRGGAVVEGRDAGTKIVPDARVKFFLVASARERARRRVEQLAQNGVVVSYREVLREMEARDRRDRERQASPLRPAPDAVVVDTEALGVDQQVDFMERVVYQRCGKPFRWGWQWRLGWHISYPFWYWLLGMEVYGRHRIPRGPVILAPNHQSYWDPPLIGAAAKREVYYLAKEELFQNRAFGGFIRAWNARPIKKSTAAVEAFREAIRALEGGAGVVLFPEGTRNKTDAPLLPLKLGPALLSQITGVPMVPVWITKTRPPRATRWATRRQRLRVVFGWPLWPQEFPEGREGVALMTKALGEALFKLWRRVDEPL